MDRRHDLPNIIRKRTRAHEQVVKNRKKIGRTSLIIDEKNKQLEQNLTSNFGEQNDIQLKKELDASWSGDGTKIDQRKEWINWYEHTNVVGRGNIKGTFNPIDATSQLAAPNTPQNIMNPLIANIGKKTGDPESFDITGKGNDEVPILNQKNILGQKMKGDISVAHPINPDHPTLAIQEPATNLIKVPGTAPAIPVNTNIPKVDFDKFNVNIQKLRINAIRSIIKNDDRSK